MWEQFSNIFSNQQQQPINTYQKPSFDFGLSSYSSNPMQMNPYETVTPDFFSRAGAFGNNQTGGWAMPALQGIQSMFNWNQGNKAMGLAEDQFNLGKELAQKNLANQTSLLNTAMRDRQDARRSTSGSYQSTEDYMKNSGV